MTERTLRASLLSLRQGKEAFDDRAVAVSVVLAAAGRGTRLGLNMPKALVDCAGRTLIEWQLALCRDVDEVVVVVGFDGDRVAEHVLGVRRDAVIVTNAEYDATLAAASVVLGARAAKHRTIISLLGDVLVHPGDWASFLAGTGTAVGIGLASPKQDAVYVELDSNMSDVIAFRQEPRRDNPAELTWVGVCRTGHEVWRTDETGHVFQTLERHLPIKSVRMRAQEVDYRHDLPRAEAFADRFLVGHVDER